MSLPKNKKICLICEKVFFVFPGRVKFAKYCSRICDGVSKKNGFDKNKYRKKYYKKNKEKIIKKSVEWGRKNKKLRKISKDKWRVKNKELTNFLSRQYHYRRKHNEGSITFEQQLEIYKRNPMCVYCGKNKSNTIDHIVALIKGGSNNFENLVASCVNCNSKKGDKDLIKWSPAFYYFNEKLNRVVFNR